MKTSPGPLGGSTLRPGPASEVRQGLYSPPLVGATQATPHSPPRCPGPEPGPFRQDRDAWLRLLQPGWLLQPPPPSSAPACTPAQGPREPRALPSPSAYLPLGLQTREGLPPEPLTSPGPKRVLSPTLSPLDLAPPIGPGSDGASRPCPSPLRATASFNSFPCSHPIRSGGPSPLYSLAEG